MEMKEWAIVGYKYMGYNFHFWMGTSIQMFGLEDMHVNKFK